MKTGELINKALEGFRTHGWCTKFMKDDQGRMCAVGGVMWAQTGDALWRRDSGAYRMAIHALNRHIPEDFQGKRTIRPLSAGTLDCDFYRVEARVVDYNNSRETFTEIEEWFEKTALNEGITLE